MEQYVLTAPVQEGEQVGSVSYYYGEMLLFTLPLLAETSLLPTPASSPVPEIRVEASSALPVSPAPSPLSQDTAQKSAGSLLVWMPLVLLLLGTGIYILAAGRRKSVHLKKK